MTIMYRLLGKKYHKHLQANYFHREEFLLIFSQRVYVNHTFLIKAFFVITFSFLVVYVATKSSEGYSRKCQKYLHYSLKNYSLNRNLNFFSIKSTKSSIKN